MVLRNWAITNIFIFSSGWFSCREWIAFVQTGLQLFWHSKFKAKRLVGLQNRHTWSFDKKRQRHNFQKERPFLELMSGNLQETFLQQNANHKTTYGETRLVAGRRLERLGKDVRTYQVVGKPLFSAINAIYICV